MRATVFLRHLRREARGGGARLVFFAACLAVGVGAVVSVAGVADGLDRAVRGEARQLLAADLLIEGRRPIPDEMLAAVDALPGSRRTAVLEMPTVVAVPEGVERRGLAADARRSQLVELKAVGGTYPYYGALELEPPAPTTNDIELDALLGDDGVAVGPDLLRRLGLALGDPLRVGSATFTVRHRVEAEPDRIAGAFEIGPRVFVSSAGLERAQLEQFGSRITYRSLVRLPPTSDDELTTIAESIAAAAPSGSLHRVETWREAQPALRQGLRRTESFLGLAALLSLLIGGIGVAQTVRSWLAGRLDAIAVLKCLGYRPREVLGLYLGQTAVLGLAASLAGIVFGVVLQLVVVRLFAGILPVDTLDPVQPLAWAQGLLLGTGIAVLFALPTLDTARRVPPVRVLRRSAEPLPMSRVGRVLFALALLGGVFAIASWQATSMLRGALFTGGLALATALLTAGAYGVMRLAASPRRGARLWWRHGLSALARPGAATVGAVVALGLGVLVVLAMHLVERSLASRFDQDLPEAAPTTFLVDIQPDQWPAVRDALDEAGARDVQSVPVVMARFAALDGRAVDEIVAEREAVDAEGGDGDLWALRREQRLTYLEQLPEDNRIVAGALWPAGGADDGIDEVSIEQEFAADIGVGVGSTVTVDIQGVELPLRVTSLRTVDWGTFGINFFLVVEPGVLDDAPQFRIAAASLDAEVAGPVQDRLALAYPNVSVIQIREVLEKVTAILERLALGIRILGWLTVLAGLAILAGAVSAGAVRRGAEVALYKTLGMTRRQVVATYAVEYALVGLVAGLVGTAGGGALAYTVLTRGMEVEWAAGGLWAPAAVLATVVLSVGAGLAASVQALRKRPIEVLRAAET
ncbi:MAG: FtsX-like permease family protein [Acidobacteriota bacterium]